MEKFNKMVGIGLMSGTSLDGLDICAVAFEGKTHFEILASKTVIYSDFWREKLALASGLNAADLFALNAEFGAFLGQKTHEFILDQKMEVDFVASHGHTVFHQPDKGFTVQIGSAFHFQKYCNVTVINDFRSLDVALGGQGAPLVPIGDCFLFSEYDCCLNLGGFSNVSFKLENEIKAYDICPVNIVSNQICRENFSCDFDEDGKLARSGKLLPGLFEALNTLPFYHRSPPKSLGVEWLNAEFYPILFSFEEEKKEDLLCTLNHHTAFQIHQNCKNVDKVLLTGGGAKNKFLLDLLANTYPISFHIPPEEIIDFKEALIFAFMGYLRWHHQPNVLASVTGAKSDSSSGVLYPKLLDKQC